MRVSGKILLVPLILALFYGAFLLAERMTRQELTRVTESSTQETACLMWQPRLLRGDGICAVDLRNPEGKILDTASLGTVGSGLDALQQFGVLAFQGQDLTIASRLTRETVQRFKVRDDHLQPQE